MPISVSLNLWKPWIRNVITEFNRMYPLLSWGTYGGHEPTEDRATDGMVPAWQTTAGNAIGWAVARFLWANRKKYNIWYEIFDGKIISQTRPEAGWARYFAASDPNPSRSHKNHVHVSFYSNDPGGLAAGPVLTGWDGKSFPGAQYFYIGAQGPHVTWLGQRLVAHGWTGYMVGPGTEFHPNDQKGVKWFQEKQGWTGSDADGIPGPLTWSLLAAEPATVPPVTPPVVVPPKPVLPTYTVKAGDTLSSIAARLGTNWQSLAALNPGVNPDRIRVGQVLTVPKTVPPVVVKPKPEPEPAVNTINVVFANVLRRTDPDKNRKRWPDRVANIIKHIQSADPDVVLANELDEVTAADVAKRLGSVWWYQRLKGIGVFWRSDVFDFTEGRNIQHYFSTKDNRYFFAVPVKHKKSGETIWLSTSHLENDGDPKTNGEAVRKVQATEIAAKSKGAGKWILGADFNSTTRSNGTNPVKPRVILHKAGWKFLTDQTGVANRDYASHHGGLSKTPKGPWIDDLAWKGLTYVDGSLIRTDGTDASDHHFLTATFKV